jgi:hypothetical protein
MTQINLQDGQLLSWRRTVGGFGLDGVAVGRDEDTRHEAERPVALRHNVTLHVPVIVLAGPHKAARGLEALSNHVVDEAVLVPGACFLEVGFVRLEDFFKDRDEPAGGFFKSHDLCDGKVSRSV